MIAETPQIDVPIGSRLVIFGGNPNRRPSQVISAIDTARLPFLLDDPLGAGGGGDGQGGGEGGGGEDKPRKRGGRRAAVECACQPPRKLHLTPKQIEDGPVICGVCREPFEAPEDSDQDEAGDDRPDTPLPRREGTQG